MLKNTNSNDLSILKKLKFDKYPKASKLLLTLICFISGVFCLNASDFISKHEKSKTLVIIDSDLPDAHILIDAAKQQYNDPHIQVLNKEASSKKQLVDLLNSYPEASLSEFVLFSHGSPGAIHLGGEKIDKNSIDLKVSRLFDALENALSRDANVSLYGCEIAKGQAGLDFIRRMEEKIQAKISASTNLTGGLVSGGDWILEISNNKFNNLDLDNYNFFLQTTTIDFNSEAFVEGADYGSDTYISGDYRLVYSSGNFFEDTDSGSSGSNGLLIAQYVNNETLTIETVSGNEFDLVSLFLTNYFNYTATIEAFKDGTSVTSIPLSPSTNGSVISFNSDFDNIDQAIITFSPGAFDIIDDITFGPPISSLTPPNHNNNISHQYNIKYS
jgi:hypothetical protein